MKRIFIDADILCYRSSSAAQKDIDWGDGLYTCHAYLSDAEEVLFNTLQDIEDKLHGYGYDIDKDYRWIFCFSGKNNFRKNINTEYKSNRVNHRKPTCYYALVESLKSSLSGDRCIWMEEDGLEGDDLIGILATFNSNDDNIIVSMDKDFKTIPCDYLNFSTGERYSNNWMYLNAFYNIMYQTMKGDVVDGYKGAKGYGDKKAMSLIKEYENKPLELWNAVVKEAFKDNLEEALMNYRMAHLLWNGEYDFEKHTVIFKTPEELINSFYAKH